MKTFFLSMIMCSSIQSACMQPYTYPTSFNSSYDCLLDGYLKSHDKLIEIGADDVNEYGIYIKFDCIEITIPKATPKGQPT